MPAPGRASLHNGNPNARLSLGAKPKTPANQGESGQTANSQAGPKIPKGAKGSLAGQAPSKQPKTSAKKPFAACILDLAGSPGKDECNAAWELVGGHPDLVEKLKRRLCARARKWNGGVSAPLKRDLGKLALYSVLLSAFRHRPEQGDFETFAWIRSKDAIRWARKLVFPVSGGTEIKGSITEFRKARKEDSGLSVSEFAEQNKFSAEDTYNLVRALEHSEVRESPHGRVLLEAKSGDSDAGLPSGLLAEDNPLDFHGRMEAGNTVGRLAAIIKGARDTGVLTGYQYDVVCAVWGLGNQGGIGISARSLAEQLGVCESAISRLLKAARRNLLRSEYADALYECRDELRGHLRGQRQKGEGD